MPPATAGPEIAPITGLDNSNLLGPKGPLGISLPFSFVSLFLGISKEDRGLEPFNDEAYFKSHPAQNAPPSPQNTATEASLLLLEDVL